MNVGVTDHAVEQYRKKVLRYCGVEMTDEEIRSILMSAVERGKCCGRLPGGVKKYALGDVVVVADVRDPENTTVITFLGDRNWRWWWKHRETKVRRSSKVLAAL
ncbi:MAG: hypothetical protein K6U74_11210 [Firmicutes bacterium]|nr:hypothetical protein [Bacillota bacterium]